MLGKRQFFLILLIEMIMTLSTSGGYLSNRPDISSLWNIPPTLSTVQNISVKISNNDTHAINIGKISTKKLDIKPLDETPVNESSCKNISETGSGNTEKSYAIEHNASSFRTNSNSSRLRNIILILVDTTNQEKENCLKNFERTHSFPVHGYLKVDTLNEESPMKVDLIKFLFPGRKEDKCECKETLRSNISELLTWAHEVKEMTTSVLSATNFSIPVTPNIEEMFEAVKNNESSESSTKGTIRKRQLQQNDSTPQFMDSHERNNSDSPIIIASNVKKENNDDMWDVIDMFTKIRVAFFRAMIDSLSSPTNETMDDELPFQELPRLQTGFINVVDDALKNLETVSGDKGYVLVLVVPENELDSLMDLLRHEISLSETLEVVTELCSKTTKRVSFFAKGPAASIFQHTRAIGELSDTIKSIVRQACQERACKKNRQRHAHEIPIRVIRDATDPKNVSTAKKIARSEPDIVENRIHDHLMNRMDTSSSSNLVYNTVSMFLGITMSLIVLITINSS